MLGETSPEAVDLVGREAGRRAFGVRADERDRAVEPSADPEALCDECSCRVSRPAGRYTDFIDPRIELVGEGDGFKPGGTHDVPQVGQELRFRAFGDVDDGRLAVDWEKKGLHVLPQLVDASRQEQE